MKRWTRLHFLLWIATLVSGGVAAVAGPTKVDEDEKPQNRSSRAEILYQTGRDGYQAGRLYSDFGLSPDWQLNISGAAEKSSTAEVSTSAQAGANSWWGESGRIKFGLQFRLEPNDVSGAGFYLGGAYVISDLWDSDWMTEVSLDLNSIRYAQTNQRRLSRILGNTVLMTSWTLGVTQDVLESLQATLSYTGYGYGNSTAETLSNAISNRPNVSVGLLQLVDGLPKSNINLGLIWQVSNWTFVPTYSSTTLAFDEKLSGWNLQVDYQWSDDMGVTAEASLSSGTQTSSLFGAGLFFQW
jgi:hypothetical protein